MHYYMMIQIMTELSSYYLRKRRKVLEIKKKLYLVCLDFVLILLFKAKVLLLAESLSYLLLFGEKRS